MKPPTGRVGRIAEKLRLRLKLGWQFATTFEDSPHRALHRVSCSQSGEDMIVWTLCSFLGLARPIYLDIGAHHPLRLNNTALFSLLGSRGINIEPDPALFAAFPRARPRDINLNIGIAAIAGEMDYYRMSDPTLNTFSQTEAERATRLSDIRLIETIRLPVEPITAVLDRYRCAPDFLSIDTEGHDLAILHTLDFERYRPAVICAETLESLADGSKHKNSALIEFVSGLGYRVYADTYINTIFLDERRV